jgi:hypothetical protein
VLNVLQNYNCKFSLKGKKKGDTRGTHKNNNEDIIESNEKVKTKMVRMTHYLQ